MKRNEKEQLVTELTEKIKGATAFYYTDFTGLNVKKMTELRRRFRKAGVEYVVIKNTLALIAVKDSPLQKLTGTFAGMTAVAYNTTDAVALAKVLTKFAKDVPTVQFKGAMLAGQIVAAGEIQNIANLPSREELVSKLLYLMQFPIRGLAVVLNGTIRNFAVVLDQIAKQKGGGAEASEAPAEA
jgi:large subunit ribosomal protein L10